MADSLYSLACILRSKNSGPFEITLDILFDKQEAYLRVKNANIITTQLIANLYHIKENSVKPVVYFDSAMGIKITFLRGVSSGTVGDTDVYGAQQHAPLIYIMIP